MKTGIQKYMELTNSCRSEDIMVIRGYLDGNGNPIVCSITFERRNKNTMTEQEIRKERFAKVNLKTQKFKQFDVVETINGSVGFVTEVGSDNNASVMWFVENDIEKSAWWKPEEILIVSNIMQGIAEAMLHPFGTSEVTI